METLNTTVTKASLTQDVISHGALKIIRVPPGHLGLGTLNGRPVVLGTGRHLVNDPLFVFTRTAPMSDSHIHIGVVHIITVPQGRVGLCTVNATAHFLEPGRHNICNERFAFVGFRDSTDEHINVGSKHRIVVPAGRVGLAWNEGEPLLLDPGRTFNIDSATFRYTGSKSVVEPVIVHGRLKIVTVKQGSAGISYDDGRLVVLEVRPRCARGSVGVARSFVSVRAIWFARPYCPARSQPGRHTLTKPSHYLAGFLSLSEVVLPVTELTSMTSDNVGIQLDAAISLRVVDAAKAVTSLCTTSDDLSFSATAMHATIMQKAKVRERRRAQASCFSAHALVAHHFAHSQLALSIIIGNNRLNNSFRATARLARSKAAAAGTFDSDSKLDAQHTLVAPLSAGAGAGASAPAITALRALGGGPSAPPEDEDPTSGGDSFKQAIHDVFMHAFASQMLESGVQVIDMSIEDVKVKEGACEAGEGRPRDIAASPPSCAIARRSRMRSWPRRWRRVPWRGQGCRKRRLRQRSCAPTPRRSRRRR